MQTSNRLLFLGCAALVAACGGESFSEGEGDAGDAGQAGEQSSGGKGGSSASGGSGGSSAGSGGNVSAGSGGAIQECAGRPCNAPCTPVGNARDSDAAEPPVGYCAPDGTCSSVPSMCSEPECRIDGDCAVPEVCAICDDGSSRCATARCAGGVCEVLEPECPPACQSDEDCGVPLLPCGTCPDGTSACPGASCQMGKCVTNIPLCPGDPCEGLACGDPCTPGASSGSGQEGATAIMTCNQAGQCVYGISECGEPCMTANDCAQDGVCTPCAGGTCAVGQCVGNHCSLVCPSGRLPCGDSADCPPPPPSCAPCPSGSCQGAVCIDNECRMACPTDELCDVETDCPSCDVCTAAPGDADQAGDVACFPPSCLQNRCYIPCN
jgi:hypothetical protein